MFFVIKKTIIVQSNTEYISFGFDGYLYLSIPLNEKNKFVFMQLTLFQVQIIFVWNFSHFSLNIKQISYLSLWLTTVPLTFIMEPNYKPCLSLLRDNALFILNVVWICCFPPFLLSINYYRTLIKYSKITLYSSLINMEFLPLWKYYFDFYFFF